MFPNDFVVVDYDVDHRVPLILGRSFLRTARTLVDVYGEDLILRVDTDAFPSIDSIPLGIDNEIFDAEGDILFLKKLLNTDSTRDLPPQELNNEIFNVKRDILLLEKLLNIDLKKDPPSLELNNDLVRDILFLENLFKDEPLEIYHFIGEPSDTFLMGDKEIKFNPLKDIDDHVPIPRVSKTPLDSFDSILDTFDSAFTNPLFELEFEYSLNYDNLIFDI
nr:reverse transcriptase domain-containing protein [Tanacetum cinerariifolium]